MDQAYVFRTSFAQQRLWFLNQLVPGNSAYNINTTIRVRRAFQPDPFRAAVNEIAKRHETLRTTFTQLNGEPVQVISPSGEPVVLVVDLRHLPEAEREQEALRLATEDAQRPFDLSVGPLLRTSLLQLGDEDFVLVLTMHHIVADGWSMNIFFDELAQLYEWQASGSDERLPELSIQYADFAVSQAKWLHGPEGEAQLAYWKRKLSGLPVLQLHTDYPRPEFLSFAGAAQSFWVPENLYLALKELSRREQATLFMTALAGFQTLLHRYTGQDDIVVGSPIANRNREEIESLIGFFVNSLVLRTDFSGDPTFVEALQRVREVCLEAYDHQDLPFEKLVQELRPERDMSRNPLFQVSFQLFSDGDVSEEVWDDTITNEGVFDGEDLAIEKGSTNIDFALDLWEYPDGLYGSIEYSTDLFEASTVERMANHFLKLLEEIVARPSARLSEFCLLREAERDCQLIEWNNTAADYPRDACLHQLIEAQAERTPDAVAVVFRDQEMTYGELTRRANQFAHYLKSQGAGPDALVAVCMQRSLEMVVALLGVLKSGAAYLPLDVHHPLRRLEFMLNDARPALMLTQENPLPLASFPVPCQSVGSGLHFLDGFSDQKLETSVSSNNLAYVIYTSGSTGSPKGVMVEHRAVCNHLLWMQRAWPLTREDRVPHKHSIGFDASVLEIFWPLLAGARLVVAEPGRLDIDYLVNLTQQQGITVMDVVPSLLRVLLEEGRLPSCRSLRRITCGGEAMSTGLLQQFFEQLDIELVNIYGPTEATIGSSFWVCDPEYSAYAVPIGRPIANTQIYLLDSHLNPVPVGVAGELYIGGDGLARGYLHRQELTAERFVTNPLFPKTEERLYKTGDLARYLPDGNIEFLGRADRQVKVRGIRVELAEIEATLGQHKAVQECAVLSKQDSGDTRLVAFIAAGNKKPELWPSLGEYSVYDELLYHAMTADESRNRAYWKAIAACVADKVALDIGTGADVILARMCIEAGAKRVYAIEKHAAAYQSAMSLIAKMGLKEKIILIHADSMEAQLPERVDVCVSELIGTIGSSEGVAAILNDARRFLKENGTVIPSRSITKIAAVSLPDELAHRPNLAELPQRYVAKVFEAAGRPFDLRLCVKGFPAGNFLSAAQIFEELDFRELVSLEAHLEITLNIDRDSRLDGFLLWLNLYPSEGDLVDALSRETNWLPVFFPVFYPGVRVSEGDSIHLTGSRTVSGPARMPDYRVHGTLVRRDAGNISFDYTSFHCANDFRKSAFHQALFPENFANEVRASLSGVESVSPTSPQESGDLALALQRFLQERLPEHMVPSSFVLLDELPRTPAGKIDNQALMARLAASLEREKSQVAPRTAAEEQLATIWRELLKVDRLGVHDDFFTDLGGHSLLATQVVSRIRSAFQLEMPLHHIFEAPTIAQLAEIVEELLIDEIEALSEEGAERLIGGETEQLAS